MTYTLAQYTRNIAMIIIFTSFVNLIMPNGDFEKYIKMVLGLIVIVTVLSPMNMLFFKNKPNYTDILKRYQLDIEQTAIQSGSGTFLQVHKEVVLENYKGKLISQMIEMIERNNPVTVKEITVHCNEDTTSNEFGKMIGIDMMIEKTITQRDQKTINIPKIKIGRKTMEKEGAVGNEGQIEKNIKTCLIDFYNLSKANINITVQKNS